MLENREYFIYYVFQAISNDFKKSDFGFGRVCILTKP